jgi:transcriptional regulator with XRE-family HTH domain
MQPGRKTVTPEMRKRGKRLANELRQVREQHRQTAEGLAAASGVSIEAIRKLERYQTSNPGFFTVLDLASALELDLTKLEKRLRKAR